MSLIYSWLYIHLRILIKMKINVLLGIHVYFYVASLLFSALELPLTFFSISFQHDFYNPLLLQLLFSWTLSTGLIKVLGSGMVGDGVTYPTIDQVCLHFILFVVKSLFFPWMEVGK